MVVLEPTWWAAGLHSLAAMAIIIPTMLCVVLQWPALMGKSASILSSGGSWDVVILLQAVSRPFAF